MAKLHAVVGDVHGCFDALRRLEDRIARHAAREGLEPVVVSVGDLVDRGPKASGVVGHVRRGVAAGTHVAVLGNHEEMMLASIEAFAPGLLSEAGVVLHPAVVPYGAVWDRQQTPSSAWMPREMFCWFRTLMWLSQGGATTLQSYGTPRPHDPATWAMDEEDLRFLCGLPLVFRSDTIVVTHALLSAEALVALDADDEEVLRKASGMALWGRARPPTPPDPARIHVSGHTVLPRVRRRGRLRTVQVDTGAFLGRRLSAWCAETDRVVSVPA